MNKKQVLAELVKNLEECSERGYVFHPKFMYEFQVLLKNATGNEKEIFTLLVKQLNFLKELGTNVCKAFYERAGKKKTDYTQYKKVLDSRFEEV